MKILYNKYFPPKDFAAINLLGVIIVRKDYGVLSDEEINHEIIHTRQMLEMLVIPFYLFYILEWFVRLIQYRDRVEAYRNISYEREAYANMHNLSYLKERRLFAYVRYFWKKNG